MSNDRMLTWFTAAFALVLMFGLVHVVLRDSNIAQDGFDLWMRTCDKGEDECLVMWDHSPRLQLKYREMAKKK